MEKGDYNIVKLIIIIISGILFALFINEYMKIGIFTLLMNYLIGFLVFLMIAIILASFNIKGGD